MFLTARFYMYTNVYYHRTTRAIDLHLKEIFRPTMRIVFPWDLRKDLHPYLHLTEWTLLEEVGRWHEAEDPERRALGREWRQVLDRRIRWRMVHEEVLDDTRSELGRHAPGGRRGEVGRPSRRRSGARVPGRPRVPGPAPETRSRWATGRSTSTTGRPAACPRRRWPPSSSTCRARSPSAGSSRGITADRELAEAFRRVLAPTPRPPARLSRGPPRDQGAHRGGPGGVDLPPGRLRPRPARRGRDVAAPGAGGPHPDFQATLAPAGGGPGEASCVVEVRYRPQVGQYLLIEAQRGPHSLFTVAKRHWPTLVFVFVTDHPEPGRSCFPGRRSRTWAVGNAVTAQDLHAHDELRIFRQNVEEHEALRGGCSRLLTGG